MARRRSKKGDAALLSLLLLIGVPVWLFQNHPGLAIFLVAALILGLVLYAGSRSCEICGVSLKRTVYHWNIDGKRKRVCPNCNRTLERRQSDHALASI